ncbi:hypothetical protein GGR02_001109 [Anoxybacillus voinovskiensis]|uniref:Permease n=1 Tax=Anoxybacteroides voinovskiense TaxID=230470 RepID=A0A840DSV4_9BACL|nr:permease [Anoxybacillus voinovskiensis]MBB4073347.1 hypothetical protein [Anoxybacillus voinovskiensis]GGJ61992.1 hypothetical protein GCM10008982_08820 [Anoxybacillus voinovskiensis]
MFNLPPKFSSRWYWITGGVFLLLFIMLLLSRFMLHVAVDAKNVIAFLIVSFLLAMIAGVGGFFGGTTYFTVSFSFYVIAIMYLLFLSWTRANDGWSDLTSIIAFLFLAGIGMVAGVLAQLVRILIKRQ